MWIFDKALDMNRVRVSAVTLMGLMAIMTPVAAQTSSDARQFTPDYFSQYAPQTAADMVSRIPGFSISGGNNGGRGLGQGGANILINGARISGKSTGPRDALARIPANTVIAIEIVDGASLSIAGLSGQVANIKTKSSGLSGTWAWTPEFRNSNQPRLGTGNISIAGTKGKLDYTLTGTFDGFRGGGRGPEIETDASGTVFEVAQEKAKFEGEDPEVSLALTYNQDAERTANLNISYRADNFNATDFSNRTAVTDRGLTEQVIFSRYEDETEGEISADYSFPVGSGVLKLIGVRAFEDSPSRSQIEFFDRLTGRKEGVQFYSDGEEGETILRGEYSFAPQAGQDWQISAENAFNFLEVNNRLFEAIGSADFAEEPLDDPNVRVEEKRSEITVTHNRTLSPKLNVQISLGAEISEITQSGNSSRVREFVRPKGFINASYAYDESFDIRFEADRRVGQLNFFDFVSSVNLANETEDASNPELVPVQYWNLAIELDKDFGEGNSALLRLFYEDIEDLVDRVPVGVDGDAVGNLDKASAIGAIFKSTLKGERWGWPGREINFEWVIQDSSLEDPLTGQTRRINGRNLSNIEMSYRHDIEGTDWAYGGGVRRFREAGRYRLDEISTERFTQPFSNVFIEHKDVFGLNVRAQAVNLFDAEELEDRRVFTTRRDIGELDFTQIRQRGWGLIWRLSISGTF